VSVVSHGQSGLAGAFLEDLAGQCAASVEVVLTQNIPEPEALPAQGQPYPLRLIRNDTPKGFGANHNAAFAQSQGRWFCVANPDIRLRGDPFPALVAALDADRTGVVAPRVVSPSGAVEDNARRFPTLGSLLRKAITGRSEDTYPAAADVPFAADWVAGMFMLFDRGAFAHVGGFDERFFLYYEDVDICARLRQAGYEVRVEPRATVIHDARRQSRRNLRYARRHLASMGRYLARRHTGFYR
jgi:GT2 family glycosyltransferase